MNQVQSKQRGGFSFRKLMLTLLFLYISLLLFAYFLSDILIFPANPSSYQDDANILKLTTANDEKISAMYLPNPQATYTVLHSHGNAEDIGEVKLLLEDLRAHGFAAFGYDYQGYGTSSGTPSEQNTYYDVEAAYHYLTQTLHIPPNNIIAYGRSLGTGVTVELASRYPLAGVILESPYLSTFRVKTYLPLVPFDKFSNINKIQHIHVPLLIIHSRQDEVIPFWHGKQLWEMANAPKQKLWLDNIGHADIPFQGEEYWQAIQQLVTTITEINHPKEPIHD